MPQVNLPSPFYASFSIQCSIALNLALIMIIAGSNNILKDSNKKSKNSVAE